MCHPRCTHPLLHHARDCCPTPLLFVHRSLASGALVTSTLVPSCAICLVSGCVFLRPEEVRSQGRHLLRPRTDLAYGLRLRVLCIWHQPHIRSAIHAIHQYVSVWVPKIDPPISWLSTCRSPACSLYTRVYAPYTPSQAKNTDNECLTPPPACSVCFVAC